MNQDYSNIEQDYKNILLELKQCKKELDEERERHKKDIDKEKRYHRLLDISYNEQRTLNELLTDRVTYHMGLNLDLNLKIKTLEMKIDEFMKSEERYRTHMSSKNLL